MDKIYTPPHLAALMARSCRVRPMPNEMFVVADFAAGGGELLVAAAAEWPSATLVGTDIDSRAVRRLRATSRRWRTGVCDFLNPRSRRNSPLLRELMGRTNLVLLNPPFSSRGGARVSVATTGVTAKCSMGLAFVVAAIEYLVVGGELIVVLPEGSLTSEKDSMTWSLLRSMGDIEVVKANGQRTFPRAVVRTVVVRFQKRFALPKIDPSPILKAPLGNWTNSGPKVHIVRGNTGVNEIARSPNCTESIGFVHSTNLQDFTICSLFEVGIRVGRRASGPMVLLPRVGQPRRKKVAQFLDTKQLIISDCVIALTCDSTKAAQHLWKDLQANWSLLKKEYVGSGARYLTIRRLSDLLRRLGYSPQISEPSGRAL